ncbi:hypothetical protein [Granulicella sp. L46]|uniref:hypothetical protein n=1 Tax=Granulicella sp. L46 TaxID=1641865 RepID=UPI00131D227C|nr:hypothetical protein [Granulicella sp. L46]
MSEAAKDRTLRFLSGLFYALEDRNHSIEKVNGPHEVRVVINGEPVAITIVEPNWRDDRKKIRRLIFSIDGHVPKGAQRNWQDSASGGLEKKIPSIVLGLERMAPLLRQWREQLEAKRAVREAERREQELPAFRLKQLESDLQDWQKMTLLMDLIAYLDRNTEETGEDQERLRAWIEWATTIARCSDPLSKGVKSFLDRYSQAPERPAWY